jgi:acetyltransferase-like isoleucine patch superfamily enzyme
LPDIVVGAETIVGAGAVVTHNIPAGTVATGVPARPRPGSQSAESPSSAPDDA